MKYDQTVIDLIKLSNRTTLTLSQRQALRDAASIILATERLDEKKAGKAEE